MQRIISALTALVYAGLSSAEPHTDSSYQLYFDSHSFAYSETAPIHQIVSDFEGPHFDGGKHSFTHNFWEMGVRRSNWKAAYVIRYDYSLNYTSDAAELIYGDKNDIAIEKNREYDVYLDLVHTRALGLKLGYQWQVLEQFNIGVDISYLKTSELLEGKVEGKFTANDNDYSGEAYINYVYSQDDLLDRPTDKPKGQGYAIDLAWDWRLNSKYRMRGKWTDLLSEITFDNAPFTNATASSNRISYDNEGKIDVKPLVSGTLDYRKHHLKYPRQMNVDAFYQLQTDTELVAGWYQYGDLNFYSLGTTYNTSKEIKLMTRFDFKSNALTLGVDTSNFSVALTSDRLKIKEARTFGLDFTTRIEF